MRIEDDINMRGSALDVPREPKFYPDESKLPLTRGVINQKDLTIRQPKIIAKIRICGGGLTFTITDNMQFEMPTEEQCENLKKTFGIEVEKIEE